MHVDFDVIVVGAGHAGCEAALAAARLGRRVGVVTLKLDHIGRLSCNPAVGGLAKGQLVREIDALGGAMAQVADEATIQFRRLNTRKGLAVQASRAQVDIHRYPAAMAARLKNTAGITLVEGEVTDLRIHGGAVQGLSLATGVQLDAPAVILTTGTFLAGVMHCGADQSEGGRVGDASTGALSLSLRAAGLRLGRLKTGTPSRLDVNSLDLDRLQVQEDTVPEGRFSFMPPAGRLPQRDCWMAHTNATTHNIIRAALDRSPLFSGAIEGQGPRYCPSIEDKVVRFAHRDRHLLFLEPEGLNTDRVYVNGLSTSMPADVQLAVVHSIEGLEHARIIQYGYAVEYDFADPRDLGHDLQHKGVAGLYMAGQVNGTSGYEEAAAQGLVAGTNAAGVPFRLARHDAYIGVLIDDLVTRGVGGEPYRMFPSRAEHRLLLREDNADRRLTALGYDVGLVDNDRWQAFQRKSDAIAEAAEWAQKTPLTLDPDTLARFDALDFPRPKNKAPVADLLRRPEVDWTVLAALVPDRPALSDEVSDQVVTDIKYEGYLSRELARVERAKRMDAVRLPPDLGFRHAGISTEAAERLEAAQPVTLGAAARLPGITPAAIDVLALVLQKRGGPQEGGARKRGAASRR